MQAAICLRYEFCIELLQSLRGHHMNMSILWVSIPPGASHLACAQRLCPVSIMIPQNDEATGQEELLATLSSSIKGCM